MACGAAGGASHGLAHQVDRGFALLVVLWTLIPLSLLLVVLASSARSDTRLAGNLVAAAELQAAADGAINSMVFNLLQHGVSQAGVARTAFRLGGTVVDVEAVNQSGLLNPNLASPEMLAALFSRLGVGAAAGSRLAGAIVDWRNPGQRLGPGGGKAAEYRAAGLDYAPAGAPFQSLGELRDVLGMTPDALAALLPHLTLFSDRDPDPLLADPIVRAALRDVGQTGSLGPSSVHVVRITAVACRANGSEVVRRAVVRLGYSANRRGWRVLVWSGVNGG